VESKKLPELWSALFVFMLLYMVDATTALQTNGESLFKKLSIDGRTAVLPLFALTIGSLLHLLHCFIMKKIQQCNEGQSKKTSLPIPVIESVDQYFTNSKLVRRATIILCLVLPILFIIKFWVDFNSADRNAWVAGEKTKISRYKFVSPLYFFDFNYHKFGSFDSKVRCKDGGNKDKPKMLIPPCGVSYLPFWQPLIILIINGFSVLLSWGIYSREQIWIKENNFYTKTRKK